MSNNIEVFEYNNPNARFGFTPNSILNLKEMDNNKQNSIEQKAFKSSLDYLLYYLPSAIRGQFKEQIEQAKAMHKQEIEEAFTRGLITKDVYYGYDDKKEEKYYNETFGGTTGVIGVDNISWTNTNKINNGGNNE